MAKKGLLVWLFSSLTFLSLAHLIEAVSVLLFSNQIRLLYAYPFMMGVIQELTPMLYFWTAAVSTFVLWGITCAIVFQNPVEAFLNKVLSDAKQQSAVETQMLESKGEILDVMCERIESSNETLGQIKDLVCNVRSDVKEVQPLGEGLDRIRADISGLKRELRKIEGKVQLRKLCPACGKQLLPEFKICPYCGEGMKAQLAPVIDLKHYK